jgi:hypothetical protein
VWCLFWSSRSWWWLWTFAFLQLSASRVLNKCPNFDCCCWWSGQCRHKVVLLIPVFKGASHKDRTRWSSIWSKILALAKLAVHTKMCTGLKNLQSLHFPLTLAPRIVCLLETNWYFCHEPPPPPPHLISKGPM